jgi:hypothetical protein
VGDNDRYVLATSREVGGPLIQGTTKSLRRIGWISAICSLSWLWGLGSLIGIAVAIIGISERNRVTEVPVRGLYLCWAGLALGVIGFVAALVLYLL